MFLFASNSENNAVSFGCDDVRTNLIQVEYNSSDIRTGAVLRGSHLPHAVGVHRNALGAVVADRVREVQQYAIRIRGSVNGRLNRSTDRDFDPQVGSLSGSGHFPHRDRDRILCRSTRPQKQCDPKMFLSCRHSLSTLAGAPLAAWGIFGYRAKPRIRRGPERDRDLARIHLLPYFTESATPASLDHLDDTDNS